MKKIYLLTFLIFIYPNLLKSQSASVSVAPTRLELNLSKNQAGSHIVLNKSKDTIKVDTSIIFNDIEKASKTKALLNRIKNESLVGFIRVVPPTFILKPGEKRTIRVGLDLARQETREAFKKLKDGEYRAHILFKSSVVGRISAPSNATPVNKASMGVFFDVELATPVYGAIGIPTVELEFKCVFKNNKAFVEIKNKGTGRFDGWMHIVNSKTKRELLKDKVFLLRESILEQEIIAKPDKITEYRLKFNTYQNNKLIKDGICKFN